MSMNHRIARGRGLVSVAGIVCVAMTLTACGSRMSEQEVVEAQARGVAVAGTSPGITTGTTDSGSPADPFAAPAPGALTGATGGSTAAPGALTGATGATTAA
ncbi:MAG: hypothetical protein H0X00_10005, partial [Sporichthya sp.]|nr:hypothetical protein [Sporichthya sp.]